MRPAALWYFESINLFSVLCPTKLENSRAHHVFRSFKKEEFIYFENHSSEEIYFVSKGKVRIVNKPGSKQEQVKAILSAGEIFGELALAEEEKRSDFAQAMDANTEVCALKLDDVKSLMLEDKELSVSLIKLAGFRLHRLERKLEQLFFKDARTRLVEFLKDAAQWKGRKVGTETLILTPLSHQDIAKLVGLSRQSVSTTLNELKKENLIYFDRRRILIRDMNTFR
jgi:CRP/FNR family transcriptional regulator, cyclic AMP receptor protein